MGVVAGAHPGELADRGYVHRHSLDQGGVGGFEGGCDVGRGSVGTFAAQSPWPFWAGWGAALAECRGCGTPSGAVKGWLTAPPKDEACGRRLVSLVLVKRRLYCAGSSCGAGSFTESLPVVPRRTPRDGLWGRPGRVRRAKPRTRQALPAELANGQRTMPYAPRH